MIEPKPEPLQIFIEQLNPMVECTSDARTRKAIQTLISRYTSELHSIK